VPVGRDRDPGAPCRPEHLAYVAHAHERQIGRQDQHGARACGKGMADRRLQPRVQIAAAVIEPKHIVGDLVAFARHQGDVPDGRRGAQRRKHVPEHRAHQREALRRRKHRGEAGFAQRARLDRNERPGAHGFSVPRGRRWTSLE
jgi:hypothetical protein